MWRNISTSISEMENTQMKCKICGKELRDGAKICGKCGTKIEDKGTES